MTDLTKQLEAKLATLTETEKAKYGQSLYIFQASLHGGNKLNVSNSETLENARIHAEKFNQLHRRVPERMLNRHYTE
jgi:autonomous glycyl radical cofactor GrcA